MNITPAKSGWIKRYPAVLEAGEMIMSDLIVSINYTISSSINDYAESMITEINGDVLVCNEDGGDVLAAKCRHLFVDIENSEISAFDLLDLRSETAEYIGLYEVETISFTDHVMNMFNDDLWKCNLLIVDRIEVLPEYRGYGLAKSIIEDAMRLFSPRTDIIALKAFPLQLCHKDTNNEPNEWQMMMKLHELEQDEIRAKDRLEAFYSELGFVSTGSEGIMLIENMYS